MDCAAVINVKRYRFLGGNVGCWCGPLFRSLVLSSKCFMAMNRQGLSNVVTNYTVDSDSTNYVRLLYVILHI